MILSNYWKYMYSVSDKVYSYGSSSEFNTGCKNMAGNAVSINQSTGSYIADYAQNFALRVNLGLVLGTGETAPTPEDYALENDVTSSFTNFQYAIVFSADGDGYKTSISFSGQNNTGSAITIKEIGVYKTVNVGKGNVLFVRHVLDTPITVNAGSTFAKVFDWNEG